MKFTKLFLFSILFFFNACTPKETTKHTKSEWLTTFFETVKTYDAIKAISYWHEDFDDTHFKVNSSETSLETFKNLVADELYIDNCQFLNNKLISVNEKKYFASFPDFCGEEDCVSQVKISNYENLIDKPLAWAYFSNNWNENIEFPQENVTAIINANRTAFIRFLPRSEFEIYTQDPIWKLTDIINGTYDTALIAWANQAKEVPANLLVEFGTEMNGYWFSWNGKYYGAGTKNNYGDPNYPDGPEVFRDAYRHIIDLCNAAGANNITWFFHFDVNNDPDEWWNDPIYYYPGDDYIDWLGVSTYGAYDKSEDYEETKPVQLIEKAYLKFKEISLNKPYAILEFGVTEL